MCRPLINFSLIILTACSLSACQFYTHRNKLQEAEELSRQEKYAEAISAYREHMQERLDLKERPDWENPYFYLILIGDIELGTDKPEDALKSYMEAENKNVDSYLVSDRVRSIARWYEEKAEIDKAIEILLTHRTKDPFLYEAMLDRLNKAKTMKEDQRSIVTK